MVEKNNNWAEKVGKSDADISEELQESLTAGKSFEAMIEAKRAIQESEFNVFI